MKLRNGKDISELEKEHEIPVQLDILYVVVVSTFDVNIYNIK